MKTGKEIIKPNTDHPIAIRKYEQRVIVKVGGETIANSNSALALKEASYPEVIYIPRNDVRMDLLKRTDHSSYCPYKGDASYFSIPAGGDRSVNAVWTYEAPHEAVPEIKNYLSFFPDRVDSIK